jgi:2-amino-4-hydroxy-6-hydroxymethyldihydropteridine diphosphokinase
MTLEHTTAYIGIGSNLGCKVFNCRCAIEKISLLPGCHVTARSALFKTEPEGVIGQDWYVNCVSQLATTLSPFQLIKELLGIEYAMGRRRKRHWEARIIDLDLLLFGQEVIRSSNLIIPHPLLHERRFVLEPLVQIAPDLVHPVLKVTIRHLLGELPKGPSVEVLKEVA